MQEQVLNKYSEDYAAFILITGMLAMFMYKILKGFSISYLVIYFITASRNQCIGENRDFDIIQFNFAIEDKQWTTIKNRIVNQLMWGPNIREV